MINCQMEKTNCEKFYDSTLVKKQVILFLYVFVFF